MVEVVLVMVMVMTVIVKVAVVEVEVAAEPWNNHNDVGSDKDIDVHKLMQGLYDTYPTDQVHQLKDAVGIEWRCSNIQFI